ncbi:AraC-like DNA-binding protein [Evansella vedderi]|uniref:AraC-like DNA-binding protein n=1 Tax=Evansella vedderi TaxID=38282 RepID=A0ABU0A2L1_9BACI|nr:AraC family transcriptional regulator [Evansella vedderi]MDQ0257349.1 AraC-like DNA-binding protein [Evansella vedderi]
MKKITNGWNSQYFRKNFILILFIAFLPGLISGIGIYFAGVSKVEDELKDLHETQILQGVENLNNQFDYLEMAVSHWAFTPRFNASIIDLNYIQQFQETRDIGRTLLTLQGSHPLIEKIELFINSPEPVIFRPKYNLITDEQEYQYYYSIMRNHRNISWNSIYHSTNEDNLESLQPLILTHSILANSSDPFGTMIVTLDKSMVSQLLWTLTPYNQGAAFLLNSENQILAAANSMDDSTLIRYLQKQLSDKLRNEAQGTFTLDFGEETYSVSFGQVNRIDSQWTYVSASPMSSITSPIVLISQIIITISIIGLIVALVMSWFASKRIYSPIAKLMKQLDTDDKWNSNKNEDEFYLIEQKYKELSKESMSLQNRLSTQLPQLKNSFLLQLIQGYLYHYSEQELHDRMKHYGWKVENHTFVVMDIQVLGLHESKATFLNRDESIAASAVSNIIEEVAQHRFKQFNVVNFYDLSTGLLIVYPSEEKVRKSLHQFAEKAMEVLNKVLQMQVTITISNPDKKIKRIPYLFEEVRQGKQYRNFENENQIIDLQNLDQSNQFDQIHYPFEIEKEILQAIRIGQIDESERLIRDFIEELKSKGRKEINIQPGITQLFGSIQHEIMHSGIHPYEVFEGKNMFEEVANIRESEQMVNWLTKEVITPYVQTLEGKVNMKMKQLVEEVCIYIQENYMEDISLESCADEVGTNPYTLSKAFKKVIGVNFIDYLTNLRIDKAKGLLLNTNMKINDIAEQVGYRHSYFNRIFKKHLGLPPSQYRKKRVNESTIKKVLSK